MTFQPPPPPPGETPPPPPPGQWGPPPGAGYPAPKQGFDPKTVNQLDWAILGVGFLTLIFSFFSFYSASVSGPGIDQSESWSAWHDIAGGGFFGWLGVIAAVAATVVLAMELFSPQVKFPLPSRLLVLAGYALAALCELLAIFIHPKFASESGNIPGVGHYETSFGHGFTFWLILILTLGGTVLALMRLQQTGGQLPGALNKIPNIGGGHGSNPGTTPPAGPGYNPPPGP